MPKPVWFRSLYWRIAIGFVAMLAVVLSAQAVLFLWLTGRFTASPSSRTPQELADQVARDVSDALSDNFGLQLDAYVRERYADVSQPFVVAMRDGRRAANRPNTLPPGFLERLPRRGGPPFGDGGRGGPPPGARGPQGEHVPPPPGDRPGFRRDESERGAGGPGDRPPPPPEFMRRRGGRGGPGAPNLSPIVVNSAEVGWVAVPSGRPPMEIILRELGPTLTWSGLALLSVGSIMVALMIFRPARQRLRSLEEAARALGEGRTDVHADERGGDEVSALAHTFNQMAGELAVRSSALTASDRARRQLLADVSHELMTPLTAIRGYTQTLAMKEVSVDPATRSRYFEIVDRETYKLEEIIGDLLDLAKLEGGGSALAIEPVSAADLFERVAERHEPTLRARGIRLDVTAPEDLDFDADPQRLEQALQNVAANAIRHTPDNGFIQLHAEEHGDRIRLTVRDSGPGIPPEHLPHIFDRFYKADASRTTADKGSGSGLGLSIVRAIVERHGGTIAAANAADGGAVFEILLPRAPAATAAE